MHPVTWAWSSMEEQPTEATLIYIPDTHSVHKWWTSINHSMTWSTPWPKIGLCGAPMMADEMQPDDQSFTDLLEVCSQNLDKRTRTTISNELPILAGAVHQDPITPRTRASCSSCSAAAEASCQACCSPRPRNGIAASKMATHRHHWGLPCFFIASRSLRTGPNSFNWRQKTTPWWRLKGIFPEDNKWAYLTWDTQAQQLKANKTPPLTSEELRTLPGSGLQHLGQQSIGNPQVLSPPTCESGELAAGCSSGHPMAVGPESPYSGGVRTSPAAVEAVRQWDHSAGPPTSVRLANLQRSPLANAISQRLKRWPLRSWQLPMANPGTQCYLNSVLLAQTWSCATMSQTFNTAIWGPWEAHLLNMLVSHAGRMINPWDDCFLGSLLTDWFQAHSVYDQHDAGEFAGWFRQSLLEKTLPQYMQAGWSARLEHSIEDAANVYAPIPLAYVMLQILSCFNSSFTIGTIKSLSYMP